MDAHDPRTDVLRRRDARRRKSYELGLLEDVRKKLSPCLATRISAQFTVSMFRTSESGGAIIAQFAV